METRRPSTEIKTDLQTRINALQEQFNKEGATRDFFKNSEKFFISTHQDLLKYPDLLNQFNVLYFTAVDHLADAFYQHSRELFTNIPEEEIENYTKGKKIPTPQLDIFKNDIAKHSESILLEISTCDSIEECLRIIQRYSWVLEICRARKDYHSVQKIIWSLINNSLGKIKGIEELENSISNEHFIPIDTKKIIDSTNELTRIRAQDVSNFRTQFVGTFIPYMGVYDSELTFLKERIEKLQDEIKRKKNEFLDAIRIKTELLATDEEEKNHDEINKKKNELEDALQKIIKSLGKANEEVDIEKAGKIRMEINRLFNNEMTLEESEIIKPIQAELNKNLVLQNKLKKQNCEQLKSSRNTLLAEIQSQKEKSSKTKLDDFISNKTYLEESDYKNNNLNIFQEAYFKKYINVQVDIKEVVDEYKQFIFFEYTRRLILLKAKDPTQQSENFSKLPKDDQLLIQGLIDADVYNSLDPEEKTWIQSTRFKSRHSQDVQIKKTLIKKFENIIQEIPLNDWMKDLTDSVELPNLDALDNAPDVEVLAKDKDDVLYSMRTRLQAKLVIPPFPTEEEPKPTPQVIKIFNLNDAMMALKRIADEIKHFDQSTASLAALKKLSQEIKSQIKANKKELKQLDPYHSSRSLRVQVLDHVTLTKGKVHKLSAKHIKLSNKLKKLKESNAPQKDIHKMEAEVAAMLLEFNTKTILADNLANEIRQLKKAEKMIDDQIHYFELHHKSEIKTAGTNRERKLTQSEMETIKEVMVKNTIDATLEKQKFLRRNKQSFSNIRYINQSAFIAKPKNVASKIQIEKMTKEEKKHSSQSLKEKKSPHTPSVEEIFPNREEGDQHRAGVWRRDTDLQRRKLVQKSQPQPLMSNKPQITLSKESIDSTLGNESEDKIASSPEGSTTSIHEKFEQSLSKSKIVVKRSKTPVSPKSTSPSTSPEGSTFAINEIFRHSLNKDEKSTSKKTVTQTSNSPGSSKPSSPNNSSSSYDFGSGSGSDSPSWKNSPSSAKVTLPLEGENGTPISLKERKQTINKDHIRVFNSKDPKNNQGLLKKPVEHSSSSEGEFTEVPTKVKLSKIGKNKKR